MTPKLLAVALLGLALGAGCMPPQMPADKLTDSAYSVVEAARFGRMDIVINTVDPTKQEAYADAHAAWGGDIRILDIEYGGARLTAPGKAVVLMNVAWQRLDESFLRNSSIKQTWRLGGDRWMISEEVVASGDKKLLAEPLPKDDAAAATAGASGAPRSAP